MSIKTATKLGLVGASLTIITSIISLLVSTGLISLVNEDWDYEKIHQVYMIYQVVMNICYLFSVSTLATFFYILHKNQK